MGWSDSHILLKCQWFIQDIFQECTSTLKETHSICSVEFFLWKLWLAIKKCTPHRGHTLERWLHLWRHKTLDTIFLRLGSKNGYILNLYLMMVSRSRFRKSGNYTFLICTLDTITHLKKFKYKLQLELPLCSQPIHILLTESLSSSSRRALERLTCPRLVNSSCFTFSSRNSSRRLLWFPPPPTEAALIVSSLAAMSAAVGSAAGPTLSRPPRREPRLCRLAR